MDYKYIKQLLDRYWKCETSLAEEDILRTFFSQSTVPSELLRYRELFIYGQLNKETDVLSDDFDERVLSVIDEPAPVKARTITMTHRLKPFFKAAAVVAIFLTLGNAAQVSFSDDSDVRTNVPAGYDKVHRGTSVAMGDSAVIDTLHQHFSQPVTQPAANLLK